MNHRETQPETQIIRQRKWRFRFSLLTFLLIAIGTGTFLGVWVALIEPIREQWKAAAPLLELGLSIETVPSGMPRWMTSFLPEGQTEYIESVDFNRRRVTDETVAALTRFPRLERLYMERTYANDQHCVEIAKIKTLRRLAIWGTQVTDNGAELLASLPDLEIVDLTLTDVSWRTELLYQEHPNIKLRSDYLGYIHESNGSDIEDLARLKLPVISLELRDANDDDIIKAIDLLPALTMISFLGSCDAVTPVGLIKIRECARIESISISHFILDNSQRNPPPILKHFCEIWGPKSNKALITRPGSSHISVQLFPNGDTETSLPEIRLAIYSRHFPPDFFSGIEGLENVELLETQVFDSITLSLLPCFSNLKHLSISIAKTIPEKHRVELSNIKQLESFQLIAHISGTELTLPDDFFKDWKSRDSLGSILIHHVHVEWQQLRPLLEFSRLKRLMITGEVNSPRNFLPDLRKHFGVEENRTPILSGAANETCQNGH